MASGLDLRIAGLAKQFGTVSVLRGVNLSASAGEFVAIVGRSGCGKSTLLRTVAGLEVPSAGTVRLDDGPAARSTSDVRLIFQDGRLLPWKTVQENVELGLLQSDPSAALAALADVGLAERAHDWPRVLSGGQRQRVSLARALVGRPRLLLLDEPLGALDALTRLDMQALIEQLWLRVGFTAVLVTHDVSEAVTLADRVVALRDGAVTLDVPVELPRPRDRSSPEFVRLTAKVLDSILTRADANASSNHAQEDGSGSRSIDSR